MNDCPLCAADEDVLWHDDFCRVIAANEPDYPGFLRVIVNAHVKEMTDLAPAQRTRLMEVVWAAEAALIDLMRPDKINLASLGNVVPHLHWHVIPRFESDPHFPAPVWATPSGRGRIQAAPEHDALVRALARRLDRGATPD